MKIAILGAAGKVGRLTVAEAVSAGHTVHALARRVEAIPQPPCPGSITQFQGDVLDQAAVERSLKDVNAVICTFGAPLTRGTITRQPSLCENATRAILSAMENTGVSRLVCMTAIGVGDSRSRGRFVFRSLIRPLLLARIFADRERQEDLVRSSQTTWSIIRPAELTDDPPGPWRLVDATDHSVPEPTTVPRTTVARFLIQEVSSNRCVGRSPILAHDRSPAHPKPGVQS